jgi:hypothetical protein
MKLIIKIFLIIFLLQGNLISGESGDLPEEVINLQNPESMFDDLKEEAEDKEGLVDQEVVTKILEGKDTSIVLPKNRLTNIFNQNFLDTIDEKKVKILGECKKTVEDGKCLVVEPFKKSKHFNNYYFYLNSENLVYAIIVFDDKKQGDLNMCKKKITMWKSYFENYDFIEKDSKDNLLKLILSDAPQQNELEVFASCYTENYRDIKSSFSIKFFKNI